MAQHRDQRESGIWKINEVESDPRHTPSGFSPETPGGATELQPEIAEAAPRPSRSARSWLSRLLWGDPSEPRKALRESCSWIVAYFFTGGPPVAHEVRDVSVTGLYVLTEERWYLGTVVRMTLTDRRDPNVDRSLTLNGRVVRWGNDGVGLEFVLQDKKSIDPCIFDTPEGGLVQISKRQIEQFLARIQKS